MLANEKTVILHFLIKNTLILCRQGLKRSVLQNTRTFPSCSIYLKLYK